MNIYKYEIGKLASRRLLYIGTAVCLGFLFLYFWMSMLGGEFVLADGKRYVRAEAVQKEREAASAFTGPMTMEKAREILDTYGVPSDRNTFYTLGQEEGAEPVVETEPEDRLANENFCNSLFIES